MHMLSQAKGHFHCPRILSRVQAACWVSTQPQMSHTHVNLSCLWNHDGLIIRSFGNFFYFNAMNLYTPFSLNHFVEITHRKDHFGICCAIVCTHEQWPNLFRLKKHSLRVCLLPHNEIASFITVHEVMPEPSHARASSTSKVHTSWDIQAKSCAADRENVCPFVFNQNDKLLTDWHLTSVFVRTTWKEKKSSAWFISP